MSLHTASPQTTATENSVVTAGWAENVSRYHGAESSVTNERHRCGAGLNVLGFPHGGRAVEYALVRLACALLSGIGEVAQLRDDDCSEDREDDHYDHQFDQGETLIVRELFHFVLLPFIFGFYVVCGLWFGFFAVILSKTVMTPICQVYIQ